MFVVLDDVQYVKRRWINRNRILVNGVPQWVTFPVQKASDQLSINERNYLFNDRLAHRFRRKIVGAYSRAPYFDDVMPVIDEILKYDNSNVAEFNSHQLGVVAKYIGVNTTIKISSSIVKNHNLAGQELVIDLCKSLGTNVYINPIGGTSLYQPKRFLEHQIELRFLSSAAPDYQQFDKEHVSSLSIIDVMMFNELSAIQMMLKSYTLINQVNPCAHNV